MQSPGIFVDTSTNLNTKCVLFGSIVSICYWITSCTPNVFMLPMLFTLSYIAMGWYDYTYSCSHPLYSGSHSWGIAILDSIFKPQREQSEGPATARDIPDGKHIAEDQESIYRRYMYLFHILVIGPLLMYVGYNQGRQFSANLLKPMLWLGILGACYHSLRMFKPRPQQSTAVYTVHSFVLLPLILYVGHYGQQSNKMAFRGLFLFGLMAEAIHMWKYINSP